MKERYRRIMTFVLVASTVLGNTMCPAAEAADTDETSDSRSGEISQTDSILAASFFGAGLALMVSSGFVEGEYEKVTGYRDVGGTMEPIITTGGSDTEGMLIAGAAMVFVGLCFVVAPSLGGNNKATAEDGSAEKVGFRVKAPAIDGQLAAIGVSHGF